MSWAQAYYHTRFYVQVWLTFLSRKIELVHELPNLFILFPYSMKPWLWGLWPKIMYWALALGPCPRTLISLRKETWLRWSTLQASSLGDKRKKVRGGTSPRTWQIRTKCIFKRLKYAPWTCEREENSKYLRTSCHHHIKCTAATFLAALMWRRPLNSIALATATHKGLKGVSDGMSAQMEVQMINKCKAQMIRKSLYNVEKPPWREARKRRREDGSMQKNPNVMICIPK